MPAGTNNLGTVVVCTALDLESCAVRAHLQGPLTEEEGPGGSLYKVGTFPTEYGVWKVALAQSRAGNTQTDTEIEHAITRFSPQCLLFVGVADGRKDVTHGDVVIADYVYNYDTQPGHHQPIPPHQISRTSQPTPAPRAADRPR
jgi:nucleoside phosphorylase